MPKILIIEDDQTMRSLLNTLLDMEGYTVVTPVEETLTGMINTLHDEKPDLVLLDVKLRQGTGLDLLQHIKKDGDLRRTRILMSSGMDYRAECIEAGADGFLLKPYMSNDLIQMIDDILMTDGELEVEG